MNNLRLSVKRKCQENSEKWLLLPKIGVAIPLGIYGRQWRSVGINSKNPLLTTSNLNKI